MKIHYTREQSEKIRKEIYDKVELYKLCKKLKMRDIFDWSLFKKCIAKYNKDYVWLDWNYEGTNIMGTYYHIKDKNFGRMYFYFEEVKDYEDFKFEERKTIYEKVKDKIEAKKNCIK